MYKFNDLNYFAQLHSIQHAWPHIKSNILILLKREHNGMRLEKYQPAHS